MRKAFIAALVLWPFAVAGSLAQSNAPACQNCHDDTAAAFAAGDHGEAMRKAGVAPQNACEACHGPAAAHAADPFQPVPKDRQTVSARCQTCHPLQESSLAAPLRHPQGVAACLDCHASGHGAAGEALLRKAPAELCGSCHPKPLAQLRLPAAHRQGTAPFPCTSCHAVHRESAGTFGFRPAGSAACLRCHTEKNGPFVYPHTGNDVLGCQACHVSHGSANPKMLRRPTPMQLCLECHTNTPAFHDLASGKYQRCTTCHQAVHGSNRSKALFME